MAIVFTLLFLLHSALADVWMGGSNNTNAFGVYTEKGGVGYPGARWGACHWTGNGIFYLFGGYGYASSARGIRRRNRRVRRIEIRAAHGKQMFTYFCCMDFCLPKAVSTRKHEEEKRWKRGAKRLIEMK